MSTAFAAVTSFVRAVVDESRANDVAFMAASIAYYAFVSLLPLLFLALLALSVFGDPDLVTVVVDVTYTASPSIGETLSKALQNDGGEVGFSFLGVLTLLWASLKLFRGLDTAFSDIYDTDSEESILGQFRDGLVVLFAIWLAAIATTVAGAALALFRSVPYISVLEPLLLLVGLGLAFFPMYYVFPDVDLSVRDVLPGVAFAAVGWTALQGVFHIYATFADKSATYGVLGGVILLVTWLYFSGVVLLVGAVVNSVLAGRHERVTERRRTLTSDETAAYLESLSHEVADSGRIRTDGNGAVDVPSPPSAVSQYVLVERSGDDDVGTVREVRLRWPVEPDEAEGDETESSESRD